METRYCKECGKIINVPHFNQTKCVECCEYLKKYPKTTMTHEQIEKAKTMIGRKTRHEICSELGISLASLKRAFRGTRIPWTKEFINQQMAEKVSKYYETHTLEETQKKFKNIRIRSIIERYKIHKPKCVKWTDHDVVEQVRMQGLVSYNAQAKFFKKKKLNKGGIKSLCSKRNYKGFSRSNIHGMFQHKAIYFVKKSCPFLEVKGLDRETAINKRYLYLWCDMRKHLRTDCPESVKQIIDIGFQFQKWLYKSDNPKKEILKIIKQRELT